MNCIKENLAPFYRTVEDCRWESDSSPQAWEHYQRFYTKEHLPLLQEYEQSPRNNGKDSLVLCKKNSGMVGLRFHGECDFNFNDRDSSCDHRPRIARIGTFSRIINEACESGEISFVEKCKLKEQLEFCHDHHHSFVNFSLMQSLGNLQGIKSALGGYCVINSESHYYCMDRLDAYIYRLNDFYKRDYQVMIDSNYDYRKSTSCLFIKPEGYKDDACYSSYYIRKELLEFLCSFKDVEDYCQKIYFIEDISLLEALIENGRKDFFDIYVLKQYLDLALRFWECKAHWFAHHVEHKCGAQ